MAKRGRGSPRAASGLVVAAGLLAAVCGSAVFLAGIVSLQWSARLVWFGRPALGRVVDRIAVAGRRRPTFTPIVEFHTDAGRVVRFTAALASSGYELGAAVPVVYPEDRPEDAQLDDSRGLWTGGAVLCIVGGLMGLLGVGMLGSRRRGPAD